jgi:hypothetical protein
MSTAVAAGRLIQLLADADDVAWAEFSRALGTLPPTVRRRLCNDLMRVAARRSRLGVCRLEHAGPLPKSAVGQLEEKFSRRMGHRIHFTCKKNPRLIGGIRLTVGDRRWEYSLRASLGQFLSA